MKQIVITDTAPSEGFFTAYEFDEQYIDRATYIDIRNIAQENADEWLEDLSGDHSRILSDIAQKNSKWVWSTAVSRLDARPWGQEALIKPFIFAVAVNYWFQRNPEAQVLTIIGCPKDVQDYLIDLDREIKFVGHASHLSFPKKNILGKTLELCRLCINVVRNHVSLRQDFFSSKPRSIICYDYLHGKTLEEAYRHYFTSLFDGGISKEVQFVANGVVPKDIRDIKENKTSDVLVSLDHVSGWDVFQAILIQIKVYALLRKAFAKGAIASVNATSCRLFWPRYVAATLNLTDVFLNYLCYRGLKNILDKENEVENILFPYEEKGIERALLYAAEECSLRSIGFTPHPQHPLAISMQDNEHSNCPKPEKYAVCGAAYTDFFLKWGKKTNAPISVWGSRKGDIDVLVENSEPTVENITVLFALSHPSELSVFESWLNAEPTLCSEATILVRRYMGHDATLFDAQLRSIQKRHSNVYEVSGLLTDNIKQSNFTIFCGTSAGIEAIQLGHVGVYVGINDFFEMNPCFNDLSNLVVCKSAKGFLAFIKKWKMMSFTEQEAIKTEQRKFVSKLFAPINRDKIKNDLYVRQK